MARIGRGLYTRANSPFIWCSYYVNGRQVRESTGTAKVKEAEDFRKRREGAAANGAPILPRADRVRYDELAADLRRYYATTGSRGLIESESRLVHLDGFFAGVRAVAITPASIARYVEQRQAPRVGPDGTTPGASNGTINRELGVLSRMLRLGAEYGKVLRVPVIKRLAEADPRAGFFERDQYEAVVRRLPADLQLAAAIAHTYGWRTQSEILTRERRHLDLVEGTLRLDPGETKNGKGRVVYLTPELAALLGEQLARVDALHKRLGRIVPYLFPHLTGTRRAGTRRMDYRKAWAAACTAAGVSGRIRHDFRRTAVRNLVAAGVVERVAMTITGHQTRAVFDRYHIAAPEDLRDAARKLAGTLPGAQNAPATHRVSTFSSTLKRISVKPVSQVVGYSGGRP